MNKILLLIAVLSTSTTLAQSGDTIDQAIPADGTGIPVGTSIFDLATISSLSLSCGSATEDIFYKHDVSPGENEVTVGMQTSGISLGTTFDYQVLKAVNGDYVNGLQEVYCGTYGIVALIGGSFEYTIENAKPSDYYYLRIRKPLVGSLSALLDATTIDFTSVYNSTLSVGNQSLDSFRMVVKKNTIELINNNEFTEYAIYNLMGQLVTNVSDNKTITEINIDHLNKGVYVVKFKGSTSTASYKFMKE